MLSDVVGERVAELRRQQGLSREELAEACRPLGLPEMSANSITNIETGRKQGGRRRREVTVDELVVIATALGVPPVLLVYPVGSADSTELVGDLVGDPWDGAAWFCGETWPPGLLDPNAQPDHEVWLRQLARHDRAMQPLNLERQHRELLRDWEKTDPSVMRNFLRSEVTPDVEASVANERSYLEMRIHEVRNEMRRYGFTRLPDLPPGLAHVDTMAPGQVAALPRRGDRDV